MRSSAHRDPASDSRQRTAGSLRLRPSALFGAVGHWSVRLRWLVLLAWVVGAAAAATQLPALSSVTQSDNAKFLPASAPSQHANLPGWFCALLG
jgi:hypothetical protein